MSYRSYIGAPTSGGYTNGACGYPQTLMMYDIAAMQHMYGANFNFNAGNTVYKWDPNDRPGIHQRRRAGRSRRQQDFHDHLGWRRQRHI